MNFPRLLAAAVMALAVLSCGKNSAGSTVENETPEAMKTTTGMPFDGHCRSIHYYIRGEGLQDLTMLCRFSCDEGESERILKEMIQWNDDQIGRALTRSTIMAPPFQSNMPPRDEASKLAWWKPDESTITKAVICRDGFGCSFWITKPTKGEVEVFAYQGS